MRVLVTNVDLLSSVEIIKLLMKIKKRNITIIGISKYKKGYSYGSNIVDIFLNSPTAYNNEIYENFIIKTCIEYSIDIIISTSDIELETLLKISVEIPTTFVSADVNTIRLFQDKLKASIAISNLSICVPSILDSIIDEKKIIFRKRQSVGSKGIHIVDLEKEQYIKNLFNSSYFIQRLVSGDEYTVDVFADKNGSPKLIIPRKRIEIRNGISYRCQIENNQTLIKICKKIYSNFKIPGLSNVQFIVDNNNMAYFIELNARFAGTGIAGILASFNYIDTYLEHFVVGETLKDFGFYMSKVAWGSIITKCYNEAIYYPDNCL